MDLPKFWICVSMAATVFGTAARPQETPSAPEPTAEHKILAADAGSWDATIKSFVTGPGGDPVVTKGTEVNTVLPGGLWVVSKFEGSLGDLKFEGRGQFGYDLAKKKYVGTWIDSVSTSLSVLEGSYDAKSRTMTYVGDGYDPESKSRYTQKMVTTRKDDGTRVFTLFMKLDGSDDDIKVMEVAYTKRK